MPSSRRLGGACRGTHGPCVHRFLILAIVALVISYAAVVRLSVAAVRNEERARNEKLMSTTSLHRCTESVASAPVSGLDTRVICGDATESLGDIAGAAIEIGGTRGVIADRLPRRPQAWAVAPTPSTPQAPPVLAEWTRRPVTCFVLARRRWRSGSDELDHVERPAPRGVSAVDAA